VVTSRSTDVGALIVAGAPTSTPLFTVAETSRLRIYVSVPQSYVALIHPGIAAHFTVPEYPGRVFTAALARSSGAVDQRTGAMLVQLVYDNAAGTLTPGGYADVTFNLPSSDPSSVLIPASSLLFRREGTAIAVASADGVVSIRPVTIVTDFGAELQISTGAAATDWVIDSPSDSIANGDRVRLKPQPGSPSA
jgi:RND family efflux transporter MFP subunit